MHSPFLRRVVALGVAAGLPVVALAQSAEDLRVRLRGVGPFHFKMRKEAGQENHRTVRLVEWSPGSGGRERRVLLTTSVTVRNNRTRVHFAPGRQPRQFQGLDVFIDSLSGGEAKVSLLDPSEPSERPSVRVRPSEDIVQIEPGFDGYEVRALPVSSNAVPVDPPGSLPVRIYDLELPVPG